MTEYDLFVECIPMIANMAARCRMLSKEEYEGWKRETMEECPNEVKEFMGKVMLTIDSLVLEKKEENQEMRVDSIKIYPCFAAHQPKAEKMEQKEQYFAETGLLQSQIILDSRGNLIDGYTSYLLAKAHGIQSVPVRYGRRQIVRASHKPGGKLYTWDLPGILIGRVSAGDKVLIHTQRGVRVVTVAAVEEYAGNRPEPLRMVIRVKRKGGAV